MSSESVAISNSQELSMSFPRYAALGLLVVVVSAVAAFIGLSFGGVIRPYIIVLVLLVAESRRWLWVAVSLVVVPIVVYFYNGQFTQENFIGFALTAAIGVASGAVLRRAVQSARVPSPPAGRFWKIVVPLLLICAVGAAAAFALNRVPKSDYVALMPSFATAFVVFSLPVLIAAAIWARPFSSATAASSRLSLAFVIAAATILAPYATTAFWRNEQFTVQTDAASAVASGLNASIGDGISAFAARAAAAPRLPYTSQAAFSATNLPVLLGNPNLNALGLLQSDGANYQLAYAIDRAGKSLELANTLGENPADAAAITRSATNQSIEFLGARPVYDSDGVQRTSVVFVTPQIVAAGQPQQFLATAISLQASMATAVNSAGVEGSQLSFRVGPPGAEPVVTYGLPASQNASYVSAGDPILIGDQSWSVSTAPSIGAINLVQRVTILLGELLLGLLVLALYLYTTNSRYRTQRTLEQRQALLGAAIEAAPGTVVLIDPASKIVMANSSTTAPDVSIVGKDALAALPFIVPAERRHEFETLIGQALQGTEESIEYTDMLSSEKLRIYEVSATPVVSTSDIPAAALMQVIDVTDARSAAIRQEQSERLESLGAMAGGLAHDFNNLLFIINGYLQLMHDDARINSHEDLERYVEHAGDAAQRGADIAKSLLSVTRSQPIQASAVNVESFLHGIVPLARQALGERRVLDLHVGDAALDVMVDPGQLSSSVLNLVMNARDASPENGSVLISASRHLVEVDTDDLVAGDYVSISVSDDGEGMSAQVRARAFEPFFTTKAVGRGSGLGLASVYSFARQSGGVAQLDSLPGEGTTVSILLPAVFDREISTTGLAGTGVLKVARVLVVDDEHTLAALVAGWLTDMGAQVRVANSLESALAEAEDFMPDTLLTDMTIGPEADGLDVAARVTLLNPDVNVVFMTGFSDRMQELAARGMTTIAKPFGRQDLYRVLFPGNSGGSVEGEGREARV